MAGVSEADVHEAMRQLMTAGLRLSAHAIRKQLGNTGSLSTIEKYRATFRSTPPPSLADLVRDEVARAFPEAGILASLATRLAAAEADGRLANDAAALLKSRLDDAVHRIDELETRAEIGSSHRAGGDARARRRVVQQNLNGKTFE